MFKCAFLTLLVRMMVRCSSRDSQQHVMRMCMRNGGAARHKGAIERIERICMDDGQIFPNWFLVICVWVHPCDVVSLCVWTEPASVFEPNAAMNANCFWVRCVHAWVSVCMCVHVVSAHPGIWPKNYEKHETANLCLSNRTAEKLSRDERFCMRRV